MRYFIIIAIFALLTHPAAAGEVSAQPVQQTPAAASPAPVTPAPASPASGDINATAQQVLENSAQDLSGGLKETLHQVKKANEQKAAERKYVSGLKQQQQQEKALQGEYNHRTGLGQIEKTKHDTVKNSISNVRKAGGSNAATLRDIDAELNAMEQKLDSLSDLSEEQQLKMQMYIERMQKMERLISKMMKKSSDTDSGIIANFK